MSSKLPFLCEAASGSPFVLDETGSGAPLCDAYHAGAAFYFGLQGTEHHIIDAGRGGVM